MRVFHVFVAKRIQSKVKRKRETTTQAFFGQCYLVHDTVHEFLDPKNPFTTQRQPISCSFDRYLHVYTPPLH